MTDDEFLGGVRVLIYREAVTELSPGWSASELGARCLAPCAPRLVNVTTLRQTVRRIICSLEKSGTLMRIAGTRSLPRIGAG
jgi:hypothetical protein